MNRLILFILIQMFFPKLFFAQSESVDFYSAENRIKFANELFKQNDFLRAAEEYREGLSQINIDTARFKMALSLEKIGRYSEASDNFKSLFFNSYLSEEAKLEFYRSIFLSGAYDDLDDYSKMEVYLPEKYQKEIARLKILALLFEEKRIWNLNDLFLSFENEDAAVLKDFYLKRRNPPSKNPWKAAALSTFIPGAGKIYVGKYGDGITALILTGLLSYLAYDNFEAEHQTRAWIFTGLAASFYAGNIYGSAAAAHIYNAGVKFSLNQNLNFFVKENNYFLPESEFINSK